MLQGCITMDDFGTKENPYKTAKDIPSELYYKGDAAVKRAEQLYGELSNAQKRVIKLEGLVDAHYLDDKGILTYGVGQTGKYIDSGFKSAFAEHEKSARNYIKNFDELPESLQSELIQLDYRGDLKQSPSFRRLFNAGKYEEASQELLNHEEYKQRKQSSLFKDGVVKRLEEAQSAVENFANNIKTKEFVFAQSVKSNQFEQIHNDINKVFK